jgi:PAS domain S-box-containing protein
MIPWAGSRTTRYGVAVVSVVAALLVRFLLDSLLLDHLPLVTFLVAVMVAAWYGGIGPALVALGLGLAAGTYFFISPRFSFAVTGGAVVVGVIAYAVMGLAAGLFSEALHRARRRAQASYLDALQRQQALGREIAQRQQSEAAAARLAAIVESSDDAILSQSLDGTILSWNPGAERLYGYTAEEILGQPMARLIPPDQSDELADILVRLAKGVRIEPFETVRRRKDGGSVEVSMSISPIRDGDGHVVGAAAIARAISERKEAEERLRIQEEQLLYQLHLTNTIANRAAEALFLMDVDGRVTFMNPAAERVFGWREEDLRGQTLHEAVRPDHRNGRPCPMPGCPQGGASVAQMTLHNHEDVFHRRDGSPVAVYCSSAPVRSNRRFTGTVLVVTDITELKELEKELRRRAAELAEADQRKDEFLAMLAHELRNPLAPIRNAVQVLRLVGAGDGQADWARDVIDRQVQHLTRLVDDLLDVSRITRGKIQLQKAPIALAAVVGRAVETIRPLMDGRRHALTTALPTEPLWVHGDMTRLAQILGNLLTNAAKYTPDGGLICLAAERAGAEAIVRVKDNGAGIGLDLLPRVFDLFAQGDQSLDRSEGGLGIGLALVRSLVQLHGGRVEAHSDGPGRGSEFIVFLPALAGPPAAEPAIVRSTEDDVEFGRSGRRVLVVDDNRDSAASIALLLQLWGHEVREAHDGPDALTLARQFQPEIVLLDIGLPGENGLEVAGRLRREPGLEQTVLVAMTGYGQEEDRRRSQAAGFQHHLVKPLEPEGLERLLARLPNQCSPKAASSN